MGHYLLKSKYRLPIAGLVILLIGLWYFWYTTDQVVSTNLVVYTTGTVLLNVILGFFAHDRHSYATRYLFLFTYGIVALAVYTFYYLSKGIR
jgi:hypothetical protein